MKTCPYCAEEIQDEAIVCKHCGREIDPERVAQVQQSRASSDAPVATGAPSPAPQEPQTKESSRTGSLILGSILIGAAIAGLAAIPRVLDVLEAMQAAANDPSAIPLMRMLEQDLSFHFITNLVIYSAIGGVIIWGWRRNRNLALSILGAAVIVIGLLAVFGSGVLDQSSAPSAAQVLSSQPYSKPSGISAGGSNIFITPTVIPSGISAGGSDFLDDSDSNTSADTVNYACQCPRASQNALDAAPQGSWVCYSAVLKSGSCGIMPPWSGPEFDCIVTVDGLKPIWTYDQDCPGCVRKIEGGGRTEYPGSFSLGAYFDITGRVQGYAIVTTGEWVENGLVAATFKACPVTP